jgi:hypothetical protein
MKSFIAKVLPGGTPAMIVRGPVIAKALWVVTIKGTLTKRFIPKRLSGIALAMVVERLVIESLAMKCLWSD